jgi:hypothetical protein
MDRRLYWPLRYTVGKRNYLVSFGNRTLLPPLSSRSLVAVPSELVQLPQKVTFLPNRDSERRNAFCLINKSA